MFPKFQKRAYERFNVSCKLQLKPERYPIHFCSLPKYIVWDDRSIVDSNNAGIL